MQGGLGDTQFNGAAAHVFVPAQFGFRIQQMLRGDGNMGIEPFSLFGQPQTPGFPEKLTAVQLILQNMNNPGHIRLAAF